MTCVKNYEMCGFLKWNFKILNKNFTIVILYIKNQIVWKTMKCADFEVKFRNIGYLLSYSDLIKGNKMCGKRWNVRILKVKLQNIG